MKQRNPCQLSKKVSEVLRRHRGSIQLLNILGSKSDNSQRTPKRLYTPIIYYMYLVICPLVNEQSQIKKQGPLRSPFSARAKPLHRLVHTSRLSTSGEGVVSIAD